MQARQLRLQAFGRAEFRERLVEAAAAGVEHPGRHVQELPEWPDMQFARPAQRAQQALAFIKICIRPTRVYHAGAR
jgi:hypothetical protein